MTELTIEAIRENPWNGVTLPLPQFPTELLLEVACRAAEYCAASEYHLMEAARRGSYIPNWFNTDEICPDVHEESEERWLRAEVRLDEIGTVYERNYGELR
ncbi:MAG TPA: hypothetical protein VGG11_02985 [Xanthobacteraceae bacterium]|jgi:hypothetical protein